MKDHILSSLQSSVTTTKVKAQSINPKKDTFKKEEEEEKVIPPTHYTSHPQKPLHTYELGTLDKG